MQSSLRLAIRGFFFEVGFYDAAHLDQERVSVTVDAAPRSHADPPFADTIFLHIGPLASVKADANASLENLLVVMRTSWIDAQTIGQFSSHDWKE